MQRQIANLDTSSPKGQERANFLKRRQRAQALDKRKPITKPQVASDDEASKAAKSHGDTGI